MKSNKILLALISVLLIACTLAFAACDPEEVDKSTENALALASKCDTTSVTLTKGETVYYSFSKTGDQAALINDPYGVNVSADKYIDFAKDIKSAINASDITVTNKEYDNATGSVKLSATLNDAAKLLGVDASDATLTIEGNLIINSVSAYKVVYVDSNGYTVEIALS